MAKEPPRRTADIVTLPFVGTAPQTVVEEPVLDEIIDITADSDLYQLANAVDRPSEDIKFMGNQLHVVFNIHKLPPIVGLPGNGSWRDRIKRFLPEARLGREYGDGATLSDDDAMNFVRAAKENPRLKGYFPKDLEYYFPSEAERRER